MKGRAWRKSVKINKEKHWQLATVPLSFTRKQEIPVFFQINMRRATCITATVMDKAMKTPYALAFHRVHPIPSGTGSRCDSPACPNDIRRSVLFIIFTAIPGSIPRKTAMAFRVLLKPASPCLNVRSNHKKDGRTGLKSVLSAINISYIK